MYLDAAVVLLLALWERHTRTRGVLIIRARVYAGKDGNNYRLGLGFKAASLSVGVQTGNGRYKICIVSRKKRKIPCAQVPLVRPCCVINLQCSRTERLTRGCA